MKNMDNNLNKNDNKSLAEKAREIQDLLQGDDTGSMDLNAKNAETVTETVTEGVKETGVPYDKKIRETEEGLSSDESEEGQVHDESEINTVSSEKKKSLSLKESFQTKNVLYGSYSAVLIAIVIVIAVVANLIASALPAGLRSVDLSSDKIYSIGKQTEKVLNQLKDPVTITVFSSKKDAQNTLVKLLEHYDDNKYISVEYLDPALNPSAVSSYSSLSGGSVVVKSGSKEQTIDSSKIYVTDYSSYYTTGTASTTFDGEGQITSAIQYVTSEKLPKLYVLTGHGEQKLSSTVSTLVNKQNIETKDLNLMTDGSIPDDCNCLMIYAPSSDLTVDEAQMILSYLDQGGKVIAVQYFTEEKLANYESILNAYGLKTEDGIVMETANHYYQYPMYLIPTIASADITKDLVSANLNILMPNALGMVANEAEGTSVKPLLQTSNGAYIKTVNNGQLNSTAKEDGDEVGQFLLAALAGKSSEGTGELVAISSSSLIDDNVTQSFTLGNLDFFTSCLSYLTADESGVEKVSIDAKNMMAEYITVPAFQAITWGAVFVLLIPLAIIVIGLIVWIRRRKK